MTDTNPTNSADPAILDPAQADELLIFMRRKMGTWVDWAGSRIAGSAGFVGLVSVMALYYNDRYSP